MHIEREDLLDVIRHPVEAGEWASVPEVEGRSSATWNTRL
jgi:hypothetical protein